MALPLKKDGKEEKFNKGITKPEQIQKAPEFVVPLAPETAEPAIEQVISSPEARAEAARAPGERVSEAVPLPAVAASVVPAAPSVTKDEVTQEIEDILSEDLTDLFLKMNPQEQEEFRAKGEETASVIRQLLSAAKVNIKKIFFLITEWLKLIPGVNKFFLEQEAKIKTDKILDSAEEFRQKGTL